MKQRLLWKLLLINVVPVIGVIILVVWVAIDQLAADYFMTLMDKYNVSPVEANRMFLAAIHRYLVWATLAALALALVLSYLLTRRVLRPLSQMAAVTRQVAEGTFSARVHVSSGDEVGQLGLAFNRMADSLEELERLRKNMVTDVAHELRTPLTNLRGYLEALGDGVIAPTKETFVMLQTETLRLVNLVEDLQQLARADAARAYLKKEKISLEDLIEQVLTLYKAEFESRNITVRTRYSPDTVHVHADHGKLLQALRNLMENAWKYTLAGETVTISTDRVSSGMKVTFANTGAEIAGDDLPYIFERFFRAERSRSRERGGAGIGLAIVKELIQAHGGQVGAECTAGETRVWFALPF